LRQRARAFAGSLNLLIARCVYNERRHRFIEVIESNGQRRKAKPLADRLGLPINIIDAKKTQDLVNSIRTTNRGQTVFVAGHSNSVPEIITALGGGNVPEIPDGEYDNMFIVSIYKSGSAKVVKIKYGSASAASVAMR